MKIIEIIDELEINQNVGEIYICINGYDVSNQKVIRKMVINY